MSPTVPRQRLDRGATAIRPFGRADLEDLLDLRLANRAFMAEYEADRSEAFFSRAGQAREIALDGDLAPEERARLLEIADRCPVHRTLRSEVRVLTAAAPGRDGDGAGP